MQRPPSNPSEDGQPLQFVVQKHVARTLHFDFRLERRGALKSWAVPKGVPERTGEKRLAIQVEDHTLEFGEFEGRIPDGEYGAGEIEIWDRGSYDIVDWQEDNILIALHGERCQGQFRLVRFPRAGPRAWLLTKVHDDSRTTQGVDPRLRSCA